MRDETQIHREARAQQTLIRGLENLQRFAGAPSRWDSLVNRCAMADMLTARYQRQGRPESHIARMRQAVAPDYDHPILREA